MADGPRRRACSGKREKKERRGHLLTRMGPETGNEKLGQHNAGGVQVRVRKSTCQKGVLYNLRNSLPKENGQTRERQNQEGAAEEPCAYAGKRLTKKQAQTRRAQLIKRKKFHSVAREKNWRRES